MTQKPGNIGIVHYQVGRTDGVSLEIEKWKHAFEEMGHHVYLCAGDLGTVHGTLIEELYHHRPDVKRLNHNTFIELCDYASEEAYRAELCQLADIIERQLRSFVRDKKIDLLVPQNIWSNSVSPPATLAMGRVVRELQVPALAHHHDFYWERWDGVALTCATAVELAEKGMPPRDPLIRHVVINSLAQGELAERKGIQAAVVPNVFDFDGPPWQVDDYNADLRARISLRDKDLLILQATRIVAKKGIELAVDFVRALDSPERRARLRARGLYNGRAFHDDSRIVLVLAGYARDDTGGRYVEKLKKKIERAGIEARFIEEMVGERRHQRAGHKVYSLWDTYVAADFVTYPSQWEGWGNQFLEAVRGRLPMLVFEYPVYRADIGGRGFRVVSLGAEVEAHDDMGLVQIAPAAIEAAADQAIELLTDPALWEETVRHNFQLGQRYFSLTSLQTYLAPLVDDLYRSVQL